MREIFVRRDEHAWHASRVLIPAVASLLLLAGCGSSPSSSSSSGTPHNGGTLTAAIHSEPDTLDPQITVNGSSFWVDEQIFDTLVTLDAQGNIGPDLATSWSVTPDGLTYTFNLRTAKWSDGTDFTSADVVYTFERAITGKLSWASKIPEVSSVTATGLHQVVFHLTKPDSSLLVHLSAFKDQGIVNKSNVTSGAIKTDPIGTGPYKLASWEHGVTITLVSNPYYWGPKPHIPTIKFIFVSDPTVALQDVESGVAQWTNNLPPQQVRSLLGAPPSGVVVQSKPGTQYDYITMNASRPPLNNVMVRQAIAYALNRTAIATAAQFGTATVNETAIPKSSPWFFDYSPFSYDPAKAKSLLADAGVHNLTLTMIVSTAWAPAITTAQVVASELAAVGITVNIDQLDDPAYFSKQSAGTWDLSSYAWIFDIDPSDFYYLQNYCGQTFDFQHYCNQTVDQYLDQAQAATNVATRKQLYDEAVKLIVSEVGYLYLYNENNVESYSSNLHGYETRGDFVVRFWDAWLS